MPDNNSSLEHCNLRVSHSVQTSMTKKIEGVYEHGMIRPLQPLDLPDGTRLNLIVITYQQTKINRKASEILAEIAALPLENPPDAFAGREHDSILYPSKF